MLNAEFQVQQNDEWLCVTSIRFDPDREKGYHHGNVTNHCKQTAIKQVRKYATGWNDSRQFDGYKTRIAITNYYGKVLEVI